MVQIDVTNPIIGGAESVAGYGTALNRQKNLDFEHDLQEKHLDLLKEHTAFSERLAQQQADATQKELDRREQERMGQTSALDRIAERKRFDSNGPHTKDYDEEDELRKFHEGEWANLDAAAPKSDEARRAFYGAYRPLLKQSQDEESEHFRGRQLFTKATEALNSGLIPPDKASVVQQGMEGLRSGAEKPEDFTSMYAHVIDTTARDAGKAHKVQLAEQSFGQALSMAGQSAKMQGDLVDTYRDWLAEYAKDKSGKDPDLVDLNFRLMSKLHGLDSRMVKVGDSQMPINAQPSQWLPVVEGQADSEATKVMHDDPRWSALFRNAKDQDSIDKLEPKYREEFEEIRQAKVRQYGSKFEGGRDILDRSGYKDKRAENALLRGIRSEFQKAGVNLDRLNLPFKQLAPKKTSKAPEPVRNPAEVLPGQPQQDEYEVPDAEPAQGADGG